MTKARNLGAILALGALTALPACSMFGGGDNSRSQYSQSNAATPPATYSTAGSTVGTSGTVAPVSPDMIRKVQTTLKQNGDYNAKVDGVWGPRTASGVRTWQQAHSLNTSGEIDMPTLQSMNIPAGDQASQTNGSNNAAATQPAANQNYSTGPSSGTGSNYSSNNNQTPAASPAPASQGATSDNGATGSTAPSTTSGTSNR